MFAHHHAILDGWSVNVFFSELHAEYQRRVYGRDADALAAPRTRFVDYVALEQRAMSDPADAEFWADHTSVDPTLVAPERGGQPVMRQVRVDLPVGMIDELRKTAVEVGVPVKALLLAAHVRLVAWLTGRNEVVTGLSFSCRPEERDSDRMLGLFLNELPVRADVAGQTWAELARRLHAQELSMVPHRWYPYALMQKRYGHPLFDSNFNFTEFHTTRRLVRDGAVEVHDTLELESTHYVLGTNYTVDVWTGQLRLILEFDEAALDGATAFLAAEAHRRIVRAIVGDAGADCRNVPLPGAADVAKAVEWSRRTDASEVRTSALVSPEEAPTCAAKAPSEPSGRREADVLAPLGYVPAPYTFYKDVSKLSPGHFLLVKDGHVKEGTYWDLPFLAESDMRTDASQIYEEFDSCFSDSVRIRMRSDVPFGAFLSGGLDSSGVVAAMAQQSRSPVETFTIGFAEKSFDERDLAREVAEWFHTNHFLVCRSSACPERSKPTVPSTLVCSAEPSIRSSAGTTRFGAGSSRQATRRSW